MRRSLFRFGILFAMTIVIFVVAASRWTPPRAISQGAQVQASVTFERPTGTPDPNEILRLVNKARQEQGLSPLRAHEQLAQVARERANDMAARHYYAHQNPDGLYFDDLLQPRGISTSYSCENLDLAFTLDSLQYVVDWMGSPGHRACLLKPETTEAGYATVEFLNAAAPSDVKSYIVVAIHSADLKEH